MSKRMNLVGKRFRRLKVMRPAGADKGRSIWECFCDCGNVVVVPGKSLTTGNTKSCGCLQSEARVANGKSNLSHGHAKSKDRKSTPTYNTWFSMKHRCDSPTDVAYKYYGAKGISYCSDWAEFDKFLSDMGEKPVGKSLDRVDSSKHYTKENCRWATAREQAKNRDNTHKFKYKEEELTITEISERWGIPRGRVKYVLLDKDTPIAKLISEEAKNV